MSHLIKSLFTVFQGSDAATRPNVSPWLMSSILPNNAHHTPHLAVRACAAAYFGKIHHQWPAVERGTLLYTQALCELRKELVDSDKVLRTETLSTTLLLALFEMITSKDVTGWLNHFLGVGHLVSISGQIHRTT